MTASNLVDRKGVEWTQNWMSEFKKIIARLKSFNIIINKVVF